jgi:hypothetical protein
MHVTSLLIKGISLKIVKFHVHRSHTLNVYPQAQLKESVSEGIEGKGIYTSALVSFNDNPRRAYRQIHGPPEEKH